MKTSEPPIIVETNINADAEYLWKCISQHDLMIQWFFENIPEFKAEQGFTTSFPVKSEERVFTHLWEITDVDELRSLSLRWQYKEYDGDSMVKFELIENQQDCTFKINLEILSDFDGAIPEFKRESCIGGWYYFSNRLKDFAEKTK